MRLILNQWAINRRTFNQVSPAHRTLIHQLNNSNGIRTDLSIKANDYPLARYVIRIGMTSARERKQMGDGETWRPTFLILINSHKQQVNRWHVVHRSSHSMNHWHSRHPPVGRHHHRHRWSIIEKRRRHRHNRIRVVIVRKRRRTPLVSSIKRPNWCAIPRYTVVVLLNLLDLHS